MKQAIHHSTKLNQKGADEGDGLANELKVCLPIRYAYKLFSLLGKPALPKESITITVESFVKRKADVRVFFSKGLAPPIRSHTHGATAVRLLVISKHYPADQIPTQRPVIDYQFVLYIQLLIRIFHVEAVFAASQSGLLKNLSN